MREKFKANFHLVIDDRKILSFFVKESADGIILGLKLPKHDIHLTILYNPEKNLLQPHITDSKPPKGQRPKPIGRYTDIAVIVEEFIYRLKSWLKTYHHNQRGWEMTPLLKEKLEEITIPKETEKGEWEMPLVYEIELPDFDDEKYWKRVKLREMVGKGDPIFLEGKRVVKIAYVLDNKKILAISDQQFENLTEYLFDVSGLNDYIKYVKRRIPKKDIINL